MSDKAHSSLKDAMIAGLRQHMKKDLAEAAFASMISEAISHIVANEKSQIMGFGTFTQKYVGEAQRRNPADGTTFTSPERMSIKFKATGDLAEAMTAAAIVDYKTERKIRKEMKKKKAAKK